jgi:hypothetical protein
MTVDYVLTLDGATCMAADTSVQAPRCAGRLRPAGRLTIDAKVV